MVGNISLYSSDGERLHTIYIGSAPEHGKVEFLERLEKEIYHIKLQYPDATYVGIADGAKVNWAFLDKHTSIQILDFYHATEYLGYAAKAKEPHFQSNREAWLANACHSLKNDSGAAQNLLSEMKSIETKGRGLGIDTREKLAQAIKYFENQQSRMDYNAYLLNNNPIGSGVTEAACKILVKQRLCCSGMRWKRNGLKVVLALRSLKCSGDRFNQFWQRINNVGIGNLSKNVSF